MARSTPSTQMLASKAMAPWKKKKKKIISMTGEENRQTKDFKRIKEPAGIAPNDQTCNNLRSKIVLDYNLKYTINIPESMLA